MQHAVITGGSGSLGQAIAGALADPGWTILAPGRQELDVCDGAGIRRYFAGQPVDLLVCCAGVTSDAPLVRLTTDTWDQTWQVNFNGAAACAAAVLPSMLERRSGHVIFISSYSALHPPIGQAAYASAKAALLGLTADLAQRHGPANIRINAVLPGFLETRMTAGVSARRRTEIAAAHVLQRFNGCGETARFIRFLHHHLPHTSGQVFQLDSRVEFPGFS